MNDSIKVGVAVVLLLAAIGIGFGILGGKDVGDRAFYYDVSQQKIYTAATGQIPPLKGIGGESGDGVLAVVYVYGEDRKNKADRKIAYLMTYSPELASAMAQAEASTRGEGTYPEQLGDRAWVGENTLVRVPDDTEWHAMNSEEGRAALAVLNTKNEDGEYPTVCSPSD